MSKRKFRVGIDIGHGSNTFPSNGKGVRVNGVGYAEHNFNSITALKMKELLESSGIEVVWLQEPFSPDIPLATRTNWYRNQNLDLIISIHANANGNASVNGRCAFFWHTASRARNLARSIISEIKAKGYTTHGNGLHESRVGSWTNLHMARVPALWSNPVPSVLMEYGFMTGNRDFNLVFGSQQAKYTTDMAEATAKAVCSFLGITYRGKNVSVSNPGSLSSSKTEKYTVKAGDTLWAIGQANGVSVEELRRMNDLKDNIINPGQELIVKVKEDSKDNVILVGPETYTVQPGDTLGEVATEFDIKVDDLVKWNNISNPNVINVGDVLKLRQNATVPSPEPTSTKPRLVPGERVRLSSNAKTFATGETIRADVKGKTYTIMQVGNGRVLLQEIMSWVRTSDLDGVTAPTPQPVQSAPISAGDRVVLNTSARTYTTGQTIPDVRKGKTYTVMQTGNSGVLLQEIMSWVRTSDVTRAGSAPKPAPAPRPRTFRAGNRVKIKQSARTYATGQTIPGSRKGVTYTIQQMNGNNTQALLREITSWVRTTDLE